MLPSKQNFLENQPLTHSYTTVTYRCGCQVGFQPDGKADEHVCRCKLHSYLLISALIEDAKKVLQEQI